MDAQQIFAILRRRLWLIVLIPVVSVVVALFVTGSTAPIYAANATVLIDIRRPMEGSISGEFLPAGIADTYIATQVGVINSRPVAIQAARNLGLADNEAWQDAFRDAGAGKMPFDDWAAGVLRSGVSIQPQKNSRLIDIWSTGPDPVFVAAVANAFAEAYRELARDMLSNPAVETRSSIGDNLEILRDNLEQAQANLSTFQERTGIFATEEKLDIETERLTELSQQVLRAESAARSAAGREALLDEAVATGKPLDSLPEILSSAAVQSLKQALGEKESELAQLSAQLGPQHPNRKTAFAQVLNLRAALAKEAEFVAEGIRNEALLAQRQLEAARAAEASQRDQVQRFRAARDALPPLLQQVATAGDNYNRALEAYGQYDMQISLSQTDVTIFDSARPPSKPIGPSKAKNAVLALLMGGALGILLAFLWDLIRPRILTKSQLEGFSGLPNPREIPKAST